MHPSVSHSHVTVLVSDPALRRFGTRLPLGEAAAVSTAAELLQRITVARTRWAVFDPMAVSDAALSRLLAAASLNGVRVALYSTFAGFAHHKLAMA